MNIIKLLPPLIVGRRRGRALRRRARRRAGRARRSSGLLVEVIFEFGKTMAKGTLHREALALVRTPGAGGGDRVLVTGAGGFIGSAVTRQLVGARAGGRGAGRARRRHDQPRGARREEVVGDLRRRESVQGAVSGCRAVFHVAALYRFWARDPEAFYAINVDGTRNVLGAAGRRGGSSGWSTPARSGRSDSSTAPGPRIRPTSAPSPMSGISTAPTSAPSTWPSTRCSGPSPRAWPASLVLPTSPVGPGDRAPTPTGKHRPRLPERPHAPAYVDTVLNVAHVEDVAAGQVLALERGRTGRSYILGGENLTLRQVLGALAAATGMAAPTREFPGSFALVAAHLSGLIEGRLLGREPTIPLEAAKMSTTHMSFDDGRARIELGYSSRPAAVALARAARWFVGAGYVRPERAAAFLWAD